MPIPKIRFIRDSISEVKELKNVLIENELGTSKIDERKKQRQPVPSNIYLSTLDGPRRTLKIQTVPLQLNVVPKAEWATIPVLGRNNPFYHYVGGEDVLTMVLDWYSVREDREDVADKCRLVESWSRSDSWSSEPPRIRLTWGRLFKATAWIITDAPYDLSLFDKTYNMFPKQAYQRITLKKVTDFNSTEFSRRQVN